jgi:hypothetical protein
MPSRASAGRPSPRSSSSTSEPGRARSGLVPVGATPARSCADGPENEGCREADGSKASGCAPPSPRQGGAQPLAGLRPSGTSASFQLKRCPKTRGAAVQTSGFGAGSAVLTQLGTALPAPQLKRNAALVHEGLAARLRQAKAQQTIRGGGSRRVLAMAGRAARADAESQRRAGGAEWKAGPGRARRARTEVRPGTPVRVLCRLSAAVARAIVSLTAPCAGFIPPKTT